MQSVYSGLMPQTCAGEREPGLVCPAGQCSRFDTASTGWPLGQEPGQAQAQVEMEGGNGEKRRARTSRCD